LSDPYSLSSNVEPEKSKNLIAYLRHNPSIRVLCIYQLADELKKHGLVNESYLLIDNYLPFSNNIHPLLPRGYLSMTLYKALAWALYLKYYQIGVIGMDNTYPRNLYCDHDNCILNLETHAGDEDYLLDQTSRFPSTASLMQDLFLVFKDLDCFRNDSVVNLDPYSLTDRFRKTPLEEFLHKN